MPRDLPPVAPLRPNLPDGCQPGRDEIRRFEQLLRRLAKATAPVRIGLVPVAGEPVPWRQLLDRALESGSVGQPWGAAWDSALFHLTGAVPDDWPLNDTVLVVDLGYSGGVGFGAEGLAYDATSGRALGGISPMHPTIRVPSREFHVVIDAAANPNPWGVTPAEPDPGGRPLYQLNAAHLLLLDRRAEAALHDLRVEIEHAHTPPRAAPTPPRRIHAVGNAHIDTAWLWPYRETRRKLARTMASALDLMDRYPSYRFALSQPQQLDWLRVDDPELFDRVRAAITAGQIEPVGAMWVEADCNIPSGESLARQILVGARWWATHTGVVPDTIWLPDVFGYPAGLPGIMRHAGLHRFVTQKLSWNDTNRLPHHTFWWEGMNGARVLTHFPPADTYNGTMAVHELAHLTQSMDERGDPGPGLYLFGYGDGGGGPTETMLEAAARLPVVLSTVRQFFTDLEASVPPDLPAWVGELYFEKHRGTYTTHAWLKRGMRRAEALLRDAELWISASGGDGSALESAWRTLLLQQFHDVLPGTSIARVNREAREAVQQAAATADEGAQRGFETMAKRIDTSGYHEPLVVGDTSDAGRTDVVEFDQPRLVTTPPYGWTTIDLSRPPETPERPASVAGRTMTNGVLTVRLSPEGWLESVRDGDREILAALGGQFFLHNDDPRDWDAWDIDRETLVTGDLVDSTATVEVLETGPVRAALRVSRGLGEASSLVATWSLVAGRRRLDLHLDIDWHEDHKLLKLAFPVAVHTSAATYEVQWGQVSRPTHRNTSWDEARFEVCAHRWVDVSETGYGVALLNDGRYGHDVLRLPDGAGSVLRLSVLRAPLWPDPSVDRGRHELRVALVPHDGDLAAVRAEAVALNTPLRHTRVPPASGDLPATGSVLAVSPREVHLAAAKAGCAAPEVTVLRLVEMSGGRRTVRLSGALAEGQWCPADLHERPLEPWRPGPPVFALGPFGIATVLVRAAQ